MNRILKRLSVLTLISIMGIIVSCGKTDSIPQEDIVQGKITISATSKSVNQLKLASDNFKKVHPKVEINIKENNSLYNDLQKGIKEKDIDAFCIEDQYVQFLVNKLPGNFMDVTDDANFYKDKVLKNKLSILTVKDKIYGFPWSSSPKILLYRKDIFEKEQININDIKTWNDFIEMGKKIKVDTNKKFIGNIKDETNSIYTILANELGLYYFSADGKVNFNSKQWEKVLAVCKVLYSEGLVYDFKSTEDAIKAAGKGEVFTFLADPCFVNEFMVKLPDNEGNWGVIKLPAFEPGGNNDSTVGGVNFMINKDTSNAKLVKEFIRFAITDEHTQIDELKYYGNFSVYTHIYNLVEFNKTTDYFEEKVWYLFAQSEKGASIVNYVNYSPIINDAIKAELSEDNLKSKDVKLILDSLQKDYENLLKQP
ncbi:ABC transporter substrate-binding protein [Clostridium sp. DJ247]|uniref:ABC transporter substrate-binding protein n=1 Tax=Clostridium sp. DJ247 TaxID=2726188 RepID=UPI001628598E|nr:ABC transporter substrate-binding protein [Clostridium sp. DJ247]MBC2579906.1 carbohydrate ABC transporter substrate-binding protein [Clostridium sp. DJ247]